MYYFTDIRKCENFTIFKHFKNILGFSTLVTILSRSSICANDVYALLMSVCGWDGECTNVHVMYELIQVCISPVLILLNAVY